MIGWDAEGRPTTSADFKALARLRRTPLAETRRRGRDAARASISRWNHGARDALAGVAASTDAQGMLSAGRRLRCCAAGCAFNVERQTPGERAMIMT